MKSDEEVAREIVNKWAAHDSEKDGAFQAVRIISEALKAVREECAVIVEKHECTRSIDCYDTEKIKVAATIRAGGKGL